MASDNPNTGKSHSRFSKQEITQGLNELYAPSSFATNSKCVDIIAVPGLGSDMQHTWMKDNKHWLRDDNMLQAVIPTARIIVYGYRSQWFGSDAVEMPLSQAAADLVRAIKLDRQKHKNKQSKRRPIIFLGHSLGGLVIAKAVTKAKREPEEYPDIINCITACVFLSTPFRGSDAQSLGATISQIGGVIGIAKYSSLLKVLKRGSRELDDLADEFLSDVSKAKIDVECYYETEKYNGVLYVDQKTATFDGKPKHSWARDHTNMNKFPGPKDGHYQDISSTLKEHAQQSLKKIKLRQYDLLRELADNSKMETVLDALDVINPKKDLEQIRRINGLGKKSDPSWVQQNEKFLAWKKDNGFQILWICGGPGKGKTRAAVSIIQELSSLQNTVDDKSNSLVLAFFCDEGVKEKSNILNVLKCLAWQLLNANRHLVRHFLEADGRPKGGSQKRETNSMTEIEFKSLPELWRCLRDALSDSSLDSVYLVISGLDQLESTSRTEFLAFIMTFHSDILANHGERDGPELKWLFLSVSRIDIKEILKGIPTLNLDDESHLTKQNDELRAHVGNSISRLSKKNHYSRSLEYSIKSFISVQAEGKSNYDWVDSVCLELDNVELSHNALRPFLESLPSELQPMYEQISQRVLKMSNIEAGYIKDILRALLLVHRPPTLDELAVISDLPREDRTNHQKLEGWVGKCGAFVKSFKEDTKIKVQLSHTSAREFLKSKADNWLSMGSEHIQHGIIALRCFDHVLDTVDKAGPDDRALLKEGTKGEDDTDDEDFTYESDGIDFMDEEIEEIGDTSKAEVAGGVEADGKDDDQNGVKPNGDIRPVKNVQPLSYCYTQWIEHALKATADVVESFGLENFFWVLDSKERADWSSSYSKEVSDLEPGEKFGQKFTALHIAAYFGYVPLADLLLKSDKHKDEIRSQDSNGFQPLYWACRRGHIDVAQRLCEKNAAVNFIQGGKRNGLTALHGAVRSCNPEIVKYLLKQKAKINVASKKYGTALYIAAEKENENIARILLDKKADPNSQGEFKLSPLNAAAKQGNRAIAQLLLDNNAQKNPPSETKSDNALHVACRHGKTEVVQYLMKQGVRFEVADSSGCTPLETAAKNGFVEIIQLLKEDLNPESHRKALMKAVEHKQLDCVRVLVALFPESGRSEALYKAAGSRNAEIVDFLLTGGQVEPTMVNKALHKAIYFQDEATVDVLLKNGANPNAGGSEVSINQTALQASASDGTTRILEMLLENDADVNRIVTSSEYGTALQAACYRGPVQNVDLLLQYGADVNPEICGEYGTPLQAASYGGSKDIVSRLLASRARPNSKGGKFSYAIIAATAATEGDFSEILELLVNAGANVNVTSEENGMTPLMTAAEFLPKSSLEFLIEHGAQKDAQDEKKDTALIIAASVGDPDIVTYLLEKGSDVSLIGEDGGALYCAVESGHIGCVEAMLRYGVNVDQEGGPLFTPLQAAAEVGSVDCVKLLLEHDANANKTGGALHSPLQAAAFAGSVECINLLLEHGANINDLGGVFHSPLLAAASQGEAECVGILLEKGADMNEFGGDFHNPLQAAVFAGSVPTVKLLLDRDANPNAIGGKYGNAMHAAVLNDNAIILIDLLSDHGADVNAVTDDGTALHTACIAQKLEVIVHLLNKSADPNIVGGKYYTPLQAACYRCDCEEVALLLERGADPTIKGGYYRNALNAAAAANSEVLDLMLDKIQNLSPEVLVEALHYAVHYRNPDTTRVLLDGRADVWSMGSHLDSLLEALDKEMSPEEKRQNKFDNEPWLADEDEDEDDDDDADDNNSVFSSDDESSYNSFDEQNDQEEIREMLDDAFYEDTHDDESQDEDVGDDDIDEEDEAEHASNAQSEDGAALSDGAQGEDDVEDGDDISDN